MLKVGKYCSILRKNSPTGYPRMVISVRDYNLKNKRNIRYSKI